nr:hypothetical protein 14 [Alphaproteobacteria bacterium]
MPQLEEKTRRDIAAFLPEAIETALESYRVFSMEQATKDEDSSSAEFKRHHDACKVAIAHIKLLIELAKWADLPDPALENEAHHKQMLSLFAKAQGELNAKTVD